MGTPRNYSGPNAAGVLRVFQPFYTVGHLAGQERVEEPGPAVQGTPEAPVPFAGVKFIEGPGASELDVYLNGHTQKFLLTNQWSSNVSGAEAGLFGSVAAQFPSVTFDSSATGAPGDDMQIPSTLTFEVTAPVLLTVEIFRQFMSSQLNTGSSYYGLGLWNHPTFSVTYLEQYSPGYATNYPSGAVVGAKNLPLGAGAYVYAHFFYMAEASAQNGWFTSRLTFTPV